MTDDRRTGYATENVTPITALDKASIDELWAELRTRLPDRKPVAPRPARPVMTNAIAGQATVTPRGVK